METSTKPTSTTIKTPEGITLGSIVISNHELKRRRDLWNKKAQEVFQKNGMPLPADQLPQGFIISPAVIQKMADLLEDNPDSITGMKAYFIFDSDEAFDENQITAAFVPVWKGEKEFDINLDITQPCPPFCG